MKQTKTMEVIDKIAINLEKFTVPRRDPKDPDRFVLEFKHRRFVLSRRDPGPLLSSLGIQYRLEVESDEDTYTIYPYRGIARFFRSQEEYTQKLEAIFNRLADREVEEAMGADFFKARVDGAIADDT
jgi:hypothetical protein